MNEKYDSIAALLNIMCRQLSHKLQEEKGTKNQIDLPSAVNEDDVLMYSSMYPHGISTFFEFCYLNDQFPLDMLIIWKDEPKNQVSSKVDDPSEWKLQTVNVAISRAAQRIVNIFINILSNHCANATGDLQEKYQMSLTRWTRFRCDSSNTDYTPERDSIKDILRIHTDILIQNRDGEILKAIGLRPGDIKLKKV
jgi:hypothetical protein